MTPSHSLPDLCDHRFGNPKPLRQILGKDSVWVCSNQTHVVLCELLGMVSFAFPPPVVPFSRRSQPGRVGMLQVLGSGRPFKVFSSIVERIAIDVVDIKPWAWAQKRLRNKSMNKPCVPPAKKHCFVVALGARKTPFHQLVAKDSPLAVNGVAPFKAWNVGPVRLEEVH